MRATVVVFTAPGHPTLLQSRYLVRHVADHWRERGVNFELTTDPRVAPKGDIAWQHLDVTEVGVPYRKLAARYPFVINGAATDVRKTHSTSDLVRNVRDWDGPVIVKTDLNFGGRADDWGAGWRPLRHPWFHAVRNRLPIRLTGRMDPNEYPVYASGADVPGWIWREPRLVVQRFLAERKGDLYGIRRWFFLGASEFAYLAHAPGPIVMGDDHQEWDRVVGIPEELRALRIRLGLDFGKIDYAEVDGKVVIYDVNPAVSTDGPIGSPIQEEIVAALVPGFESFLVRNGL